MKILYVLDRPELGGGVKVVFQHAGLLLRDGHEVTIFGRGPRPSWIDFAGTYVPYDESPLPAGPQDLVIATFWTTIAIAEALGAGPVVHFCQGYEGDLVHLSAQRPAIEAAYRRRLPSFVVTPHLADLLRRRFGRQSHLVTPPLDGRYRPIWRWRPRRDPWLFVPGIYEAEVKGVPTALAAVARLRQRGVRCRILRLSVLPLSPGEQALLAPDRYLHGVEPQVVARELPQCDLLLFPSLAMEGFGLPVIEAMVSKVPVVASRIPATEFIGQGRLILVPPGDPTALADAAFALLRDAVRWRRARRDGYSAVQRFHPRVVREELRAGIEWARVTASGGGGG
jgi:glycosyltransferase involved in cell wall biosynthesis